MNVHVKRLLGLKFVYGKENKQRRTNKSEYEFVYVISF